VRRPQEIAASSSGRLGQPADAGGELRAIYERRAELQYGRPRSMPSLREDRKLERTLELLAPLLPCESYLDAGCGDGIFIAALSRLGALPGNIVGTDVSARILATAEATTRRVGLEPLLVRAGLEATPFPDASFDVVLCAQVIEHLPDPAQGIVELARLLRPGGTLLLTTMNRSARITQVLNLPRTGLVRLLGLEGRRIPVRFPETEFDTAELRAIVSGARLDVTHVETFRFHLRWPLDRPPARRALNAIDRRLPPHGLGDIIAIVATKPVDPPPSRTPDRSGA
jgi:SAM-dependent methyltransferase